MSFNSVKQCQLTQLYRKARSNRAISVDSHWLSLRCIVVLVIEPQWGVSLCVSRLENLFNDFINMISREAIDARH